MNYNHLDTKASGANITPVKGKKRNCKMTALDQT